MGRSLVRMGKVVQEQAWLEKCVFENLEYLLANIFAFVDGKVAMTYLCIPVDSLQILTNLGLAGIPGHIFKAGPVNHL